LKPLEENIGKTLEDLGIGNAFLNRNPVGQKIRIRFEKYDCIKLKSSVKKKKIIARIKKTTIEWKKIFFSYSSDKRFILRIYTYVCMCGCACVYIYLDIYIYI
jgi:hypothetical protein